MVWWIGRLPTSKQWRLFPLDMPTSPIRQREQPLGTPSLHIRQRSRVGSTQSSESSSSRIPVNEYTCTCINSSTNKKSINLKKRESLQKKEITQCTLTSPDQAPTHCPHTHSRDSYSFTEAQWTQPSPFDHRTHPLYGRTRLYVFMALWTKFLRNYHSFHRPHTHSRDSSPFTEAWLH